MKEDNEKGIYTFSVREVKEAERTHENTTRISDHRARGEFSSPCRRMGMEKDISRKL